MNPDQTRRLTQFPLRLATSLREAANTTAREQGVSLNHFIARAVAEKVDRVEVPSSALDKKDGGATR